ncbi:hypothetical protein M0802_011433 [Mischocyttarus mexicanus]|nr:hypothetical protein M0802_011433 [Mischocyttarus mexicanus]
MADTEKEITKGGPRNPPTAMWDGALAGHSSSSSGDRHSSTVGNLAEKMENATGSKKCELGKVGAAEKEVTFLRCRTPSREDAQPFGFVFASSGPSQQSSGLKRKIAKPLSPLLSASSEEDVRINKSVVSSIDIRMDPDRILMKAMKDITIIEEDRPNGRLRPVAPPITETLEINVLDGVLDELFLRPAVPSRVSCELNTCERGRSLTGDELVVATTKIASARAPGLDGVPGTIVRQAVKYWTEGVLRCFTHLLDTRTLPGQWCAAKLVLIPKKTNSGNSEAGSFRPICLVNELATLYEQVIAGRLTEFLETRFSMVSA